MLSLKDLTIGYGTKTVFNTINADFDKGSLIALAGNNGTGKSTLLKTISGLLEPISGSILLEGKKISAYESLDYSKLVSVVLTDKIGGFNLTVWDVVAAGRIPYLNAFGNLKAEDKELVNASLQQIGISDLANSFYDELSDGQKQKVLIAKSLAQQTPVILMDEPTAFLDYESRHRLFALLKQLAKEQQKTIIVSSHDLDILLKSVDKVLYLKPDNQYYFGEPGTIRKEIQL